MEVGASGFFSVKSAYYSMMDGPTITSNLGKIWIISVPPRMRVFAWLFILNKIVMIDNLIKRGWNMVTRCIKCKNSLESSHHLFNQSIYDKRLVQDDSGTP